MVIGGINWIILTSCKNPTIDCYGSIIYVVLVNRLTPYIITILTQFEQYKYLSYKFNVIGFRLVPNYIIKQLKIIENSRKV